VCALARMALMDIGIDHFLVLGGIRHVPLLIFLLRVCLDPSEFFL
jgi:hypothetical protein